MKKILNIKPFNDFYMNCELNNYFSHLTTLDSSYKAAAYMNSYRYSLFDIMGNSFNIIKIDYSKSYSNLLNKNLIKNENYFFKDLKNFIIEIKEIISSGKPVCLFIDLYNWIPSSLAWQKHHWKHFSLIIGFDEERSIFYSIDDDVNGVGIREIPEKRLIESFWGTGYFVDYKNSYSYPNIITPCYTVNYSEKIEPYKLDVVQIVNNAADILENIAVIDLESCWKFGLCLEQNVDEMSDHAIAGLNIIYNRQIGNMLLINELHRANLINEYNYLTLFRYVENIINGWKKAKNILKKSKYLNTLSNIRNTIIPICQENLKQEWAFWMYLIKSF